jgi:prefoldin subunit 5
MEFDAHQALVLERQFQNNADSIALEIDSFTKRLAEYRTLDTFIADIVKKLTVPCLVPLNDYCFTFGQISNTNKYLVSLGDGWFCDASAHSARLIIQRRMSCIPYLIQTFNRRLMDCWLLRNTLIFQSNSLPTETRLMRKASNLLKSPIHCKTILYQSQCSRIIHCKTTLYQSKLSQIIHCKTTLYQCKLAQIIHSAQPCPRSQMCWTISTSSCCRN